MTLIRSYDKNIHKYYRRKDCMEKFCKDLKDLAMEVINTKQKDMIPLTHKEEKYYESCKYCHICKKKFYSNKDEKRYKKYHKVRDHDHYTGKFRDAAHSICNLRYAVQKDIPIISHNGSNYDYHFIIKELGKEFKGQAFNCLGENAEKYITFSVPLKQVNENNKLIIYKLKFIDSYRFMSASLSNLTNNLSEINKNECKSCKERKNISTNCAFMKLKNNVLIYSCKN